MDEEHVGVVRRGRRAMSSVLRVLEYASESGGGVDGKKGLSECNSEAKCSVWLIGEQQVGWMEGMSRLGMSETGEGWVERGRRWAMCRL